MSALRPRAQSRAAREPASDGPLTLRAARRLQRLVRRRETVGDGTILFRYLLVREQQVDNPLNFDDRKLLLED